MLECVIHKLYRSGKSVSTLVFRSLVYKQDQPWKCYLIGIVDGKTSHLIMSLYFSQNLSAIASTGEGTLLVLRYRGGTEFLGSIIRYFFMVR